jgi:uncharacterized delta-60 repeat protein
MVVRLRYGVTFGVVLFFLSGCGFYFTGNTNYQVALKSTQNILLGTCEPITLDANSGFAVATTISLSGNGAGNFFDSFEHCAQNIPSSQVSVTPATHSVALFFKDYTAESLTLVATTDSMPSGARQSVLVKSAGAVAKGFNSEVLQTIPLADGSHRFYVLGQFSTFQNQSISNLVRIFDDGSLDPAFNPAVLRAGGSANAVALTAAGQLYVGGVLADQVTPFLQRLNSDGSTDPLFNLGGSGFVFGSYPTIREIRLATDGSNQFYVDCSGFTSYNGMPVSSILRINSDGTLDNTFSPALGNSALLEVLLTMPVDIAANPESLLVYGGNFTTTPNSFIRLNHDGSLDNSFDSGSGFTYLGYGSSPNAILSLNDGSGTFYVGGSFDTYNGTAAADVIRILKDGSVDGGFSEYGIGGTVFMLAPVDPTFNEIYVGGTFQTFQNVAASGLVKVRSDGSWDHLFGVGTGVSVNSLSPFDDGSGDLLVGGNFNSFEEAGIDDLARISTTGRTRPAFNSGAGFDSLVNAVSATADASGSFYVAGVFSHYNGQTLTGLARFFADGTVDNSFQPNFPLNSQIFSVTPLTDGTGRVYVGGNFTLSAGGQTWSSIARINADGSTDSSFSANIGVGEVNTIAICPDGSNKIILGGNFSPFSGAPYRGILRMNEDGSVDNSFNPGTGFGGSEYVALPLANGQVYAAGDTDFFNGVQIDNIVRLNADGTIDPTYQVSPGASDGEVRTVVPLNDGTGRFYLGGGFQHFQNSAVSGIVRVNPDGSVDNTFAVGSGFGGQEVQSIILTNDGTKNLYAVGTFSVYNGDPARGMVRILPSGAIDPTFNVGSGFGLYSYPSALALANDGSGMLYVGGEFTSFQHTTVDYFFRLLPTGLLY